MLFGFYFIVEFSTISAMERYTLEQRVYIVKTYFQNGSSVRATFRRIREYFGVRNRPSEVTIRKIVRRFETTGSVKDIETKVRERPARSVENIQAVRESVTENPQMSVNRRAQHLGISRTSTWRILKKDLSLHPYKIQLTQELKPADHGQRRAFANWILQMNANDNNFCDKIIFSDEAHFHLNGYVNKQNCRIWGNENPREIHEIPMHAQRVTVWYGFWAEGIIGP